jgi:transmembrane sensor
MKMEHDELKELAEKITYGRASDNEIMVFNRWYNARQHGQSEWDIAQLGSQSEIHDLLKAKIDGQIYPTKHGFIWRRLAYVAASVSIVLMLGVLFYIYNGDDREKIVAFNGKSTLTLPNGRKIPISDSHGSLIIDASKLSYQDGSVLTDKENLEQEAPDRQLQVTTQRGTTQQIRLPDGTNVWLNADSKLEFPAEFSKSRRSVILTGEGYFEVAKDAARPFTVRSKQQNVEVLGTQFNISAYDNEKSVKTTLIEGSVKLSDNSVNKKLIPGNQAVNTEGKIIVNNIDVNVAVAWKNKMFLFHNEDITTIMRMIERWYDVQVVYSGEPTLETFSGGVSRFDNLTQVLNSLESTGKVRFKVKGNVIQVSMDN